MQRDQIPAHALVPIPDNAVPASRQVTQLRMPPHDILAEQSVLGSLLQVNAAWDQVGDLLTDSDFYRYEHRLVFLAIAQLVNATKPADVATVYAHLELQGKGDEAGGLAMLMNLANAVPSASNVRRYAEIVRERAILRKLISASDEIATMAFHPQGRAIKDLLDAAEQKIFGIGEEGERGQVGFHRADALVVRVLDRVQEMSSNPGAFAGTPTGYEDLDRMTTGMHAGDLIILAARPSMGKTALAMNIAEHVAINEGLPVAVFSLEMSADQLMTRVTGSIGRIDQQHLRTGDLTDEEWPKFTQAVETVRNVDLHIDDKGGVTVADVRAAARRLARQCGRQLGLIVVDYLQLMSVSAAMTEENRATAVGEISRGLKLLAKELACPVIALSQLSREVEKRQNRRPQMSDLRESGAIEQDADVIMFIYRDDYYNKGSAEPGVAEVIVSKQRSGPTGTVKLAWLAPFTRFDSLAPDYLANLPMRPAAKPRGYSEDV